MAKRQYIFGNIPASTVEEMVSLTEKTDAEVCTSICDKPVISDERWNNEETVCSSNLDLQQLFK